MDRRVLQAMQLLREAGRLDLLPEDAARRARPPRRAGWRPLLRHARYLVGVVGGRRHRSQSLRRCLVTNWTRWVVAFPKEDVLTQELLSGPPVLSAEREPHQSRHRNQDHSITVGTVVEP
ncbi:hypothetical protein NDU88_003956 [Pleurodeles waltl]|uniref:Uncharacterized protein n=1 Tax=Pleurodeles waltl TaxID=8319 RepID=A0AAV7NKT4_PLEWA|nr:hypothetical protein NDU88_003956 [Pleurodeles waltl]